MMPTSLILLGVQRARLRRGVSRAVYLSISCWVWIPYSPHGALLTDIANILPYPYILFLPET